MATPPDAVMLRPVRDDDLPILFEHQLDEEANRMVAFTAPDPTDRAAFMARWARILADDALAKRTILVGGEVAGTIVRFESDPGRPEVGYWLGRRFWGRGVATAALRAFLAEIPERPLFAWAAKDNLGSIRVLEKCGFRPSGTDRQYSNARGVEVEQVVFTLAAAVEGEP